MMTFEEAKDLAWWNVSEIAEFFGVSNQTVNRWIKKNDAPVAVIRCLEVLAGYFPAHSKRAAWYGWRFNNGRLWSPDGDSFLPGDLMAFTRYWHYVSALESKIRDLEKFNQVKSLPGSGAVIVPFPGRNRRFDDVKTG